MRTRTRLGFSLTLASNVFIFFGWVIPFWFGRFYGNNSKTQWNLFYRIQCITGRCETIGGILSKSIVDYEDAEARIELEALAIIATIGFALCLLSLVIVAFFHFSLRGRSFSYFNYILSAAIVQFVSALFVFLSIVVGGIAVGDFLSVRPIDSVIEFPWSILFYSIGLILLIAAAIVFTLIIINWKKYRHIYARKRYYFNNSSFRNSNFEPYTIDNKSDLSSFGRIKSGRKGRNSGRGRYDRHYQSEGNLYGTDNPVFNGSTGSLRMKFDPKREKYVGFVTDIRNDKNYASMPTRGSRRFDDSYRDSDRYSPYSFGERYPSSRSWHSKLDDVIRESNRLRMSNYRLGDAYM